MPVQTVNILFTSVGRRVELMEAFKKAYNTLGLNGKIVGTDINPIAPALHAIDCPYIVPRNTSPDYIDTLVNLCKIENIDLIFPLIDPDIPLLSQSRDIIEKTEAKVVVIPHSSSMITTDKWQTYQFFRAIDILTPMSWLPDNIPNDIEFPLFIKPRFGSASQNTFKVRNQEELAFFSNYVPQPIVQEYLDGPEITNDVLSDFDETVLSVVSRQRIEVRGGEVVKGVTIHNPAILESCVNIAQSLSSIGPITIQCMLKNGQAYFTEINARFGGGLPLAITSGINIPAIILAKQAGMDVDTPPIGTYKTGLYVSRFDNAYFIEQDDSDAMASHRL